jgi:hypothetical protein
MSEYEIVYLCDLDGTGSMHACSKGDLGAVEYVPADAIQALQEQVKDLELKEYQTRTLAEKDVQEARNAALEEAEMVAARKRDKWRNASGFHDHTAAARIIADEIRSLKGE